MGKIVFIKITGQLLYANINTVQEVSALGWLIVWGPTQRLVPRKSG